MKTSELEGITFHVKNSTVNAGGVAKYHGEVVLTSGFDRQEIWKHVIKRLDNLTLNRGGDLQSAIIELLQGQVDTLEAEVENQGTEDRQRAQRAEAAATHAEARAVRAEQHQQLLQAQLDMRTRERDTALLNTQGWGNWYAKHMASGCPLKQG